MTTQANIETSGRARLVRLRRALASATAILAICARSRDASALDKQGSAHGGSSDAATDDFNISGAAMAGSAIVNSTYAARPDNTGIALFRYAGHVDIDLIGPKLSIPIDLNFFTDRERPGAGFFVPSEFDIIGGVTSTNSLGKAGAFELGARLEHDRPIDRKGFTQTYADVRARYLYSLAKLVPSLARDLNDGDISGAMTLGWFALNPSYAARPDNSGKAFFRYGFHSELSVWHDHLSLGVDTTFFTDRQKNAIRPSELDLTYEVILRRAPFELHLAYERDMPLDRGGLVQSFVYTLIGYEFDLHDKLHPLRDRGTVVSP